MIYRLVEGVALMALTAVCAAAQLMTPPQAFVKPPSIFVRSFRFVQDYRNLNECVYPTRLLLTVRTRIAGTAEMAVWLHPTDTRPAESGAGAAGFEESASRAIEH